MPDVRANLLTRMEVYSRGLRVLTIEVSPDDKGYIEFPLSVALDGALIIARPGDRFSTRIDRPWHVRWASL